LDAIVVFLAAGLFTNDLGMKEEGGAPSCPSGVMPFKLE
jgi:hypothetical protein